jgi:hypothetical protein
LGPCQCRAHESHTTAAPRGILKIKRKIHRFMEKWQGEGETERERERERKKKDRRKRKESNNVMMLINTDRQKGEMGYMRKRK